jgi:hypothetical protein
MSIAKVNFNFKGRVAVNVIDALPHSFIGISSHFTF